jgi:ubiquinone/menaquinone biosynthesis C-methylase UbiE
MRQAVRASLALLLWLPAVRAQVAAEANKEYQTHEGRERIASTLGSTKRTEDLKPRELIGSLGIKPGSTVADVGTGVGVFLPALSEAVGPSGRVIAEDIQQDFLDKARERIQSEHLANVTTLLGTEHDPKLPEGQVDLVWIFDVYHHFNYPAEMLDHISKALKPDGRLVIGDMYRNKGGKDQRKHVRADRDEVIQEVENSGYKLLNYRDHGVNQYVLIFRKK